MHKGICASCVCVCVHMCLRQSMCAFVCFLTQLIEVIKVILDCSEVFTISVRGCCCHVLVILNTIFPRISILISLFLSVSLSITLMHNSYSYSRTFSDTDFPLIRTYSLSQPIIALATTHTLSTISLTHTYTQPNSHTHAHLRR